MSQNTSSSAFRKIDVDRYNEDNYIIDDSTDTISNLNIQEVQQQIQQSKYFEALLNIVQNAPIGIKNKEARDSAFLLFQQALSGIKTSEIEKCVQKFTSGQCDILMKYLYRGFEEPREEGCGQLLAWHDKVVATYGIGCVIRCLTDRRRV